MKLFSGKIKTELTVLAVIIAGLTALLLLRDPDRLKYEIPQLPTVERQDVDRVEIQSEKGLIVLMRNEGKWRLKSSGHLVDGSKLNAALDAIADLNLTTLVSRSKDYARYGMDADGAIQVKAFVGETEVRAFILGKVASTYRHTFMRFPEDQRVFHATGSLRSRFEYGVDDWRDKTVLSFAPAEISELSLAMKKLTGTFQRNARPAATAEAKETPPEGPGQTPATVWIAKDGREVDSTRMDLLLQSLAGLSCQEFSQENPEGQAVLTVTLKGSKDYHLELFRLEEGDSAARFTGKSSAVSQPFVIAQYTAEELIRKVEAVFKSDKTAGGQATDK